jgi:hypothetical protein
MPGVQETTQVEESIGKVNDELSVGEDLDFQRRWWRFEKAVWIAFVCIIALDLAGALGRGPLATAMRRAADASVTVHYERIERTETQSMVTIEFAPSVIRNGEVQLYISNNFVKNLGVERVIPAPLSTEIGRDGLTYRFPASQPPAKVELELQPAGPGVFELSMQAPGAQPIRGRDGGCPKQGSDQPG